MNCGPPSAVHLNAQVPTPAPTSHRRESEAPRAPRHENSQFPVNTVEWTTKSVFSKPTLPQTASLLGETYRRRHVRLRLLGYTDATDRGEDRNFVVIVKNGAIFKDTVPK